MLKAFCVLEIFTFAVKRLGNKAKVNFRIYGVNDWTTNNYRKTDNEMKFGQLIEYNMSNIWW